MENLEPGNSSKLSAKTIYINPEFTSLLQPHINPLFLYNPKRNIHMNPQFLTNFTGSAYQEEIKCETPILCDTNIKKMNIKTYNAVKDKTCKPHRYKLDNRPPNIQKQHNSNRYIKRNATYSTSQDLNTIKPQLKTSCNKTISFLQKEKIDAFKPYKTISNIYSFNKTSPNISNIHNQFKLSSTKTTIVAPKPKYSHVNNVKQRSLKILRKRLVKINSPCGIFQRIGKCVAFDHGKCPLLHDKSQVAICPRFLKGECTKSHCLLSHNSSLSKMPACKFYLQGVCVRKNCPYLHKKLSQKVEICKDFARGFCSLAEKCNKRHEFQIPLTKVKSSPRTLKQPVKPKIKTPCKDDHGIRYFDNKDIEANPLNLNLLAAKTERIKPTEEESGTDNIREEGRSSLPSFIAIT